MMDTHTHTHARGRWRGIGGMIVALAALMCVLVSGMSGIVAANDGPAIDTITLSASTVARGDTVTVNAHITDTVADVIDTPVVFFALPDAFAGPGIPFTRVSGDARDGQYHADWVVSPLLPTGKYPVREVRAYDGNGNATFISAPDPRVASLMLTVSDAPIASATVTMPVMVTVLASATASPAATVAPTTARATSTRTPAPATATSSRPTPTPIFTPVPIIGPGPDATNTPAAPTATATAAARITVLPAITALPTATAATAPSTATRAAAAPPTATRQSTVTAPTSTPPVATASVIAASASRSTTNTPSPRATGKGPSLASIIIVPSTIYPGDTLTVTARITAGSADVADLATLRYRLPDGTDGPFAYLRRVHGTARDGTYEATIGLSPFYPAGAYTLGTLTIADNDGNTTVYTAAMRPDATFTVTLFVTDSTSVG